MKAATHAAPVLRILLVDDDELSRELLSLLLADQGHEIAAAESGDAALRLASSDTEVVLTDVQMPGLSGSELAQRMRAIAPRATLLAMSGSQPPPEVLHGYDGFLLKPFSMEQFALACVQNTALSREAEAENIAAEALDAAIYGKLSAVMQPAQVAQLYALCLSDAAERIATMRECAAQGDDEGYRKAAHAIKGSCGMVGAVQLRALAGRMEEQGLTTADHVASLDEFVLASEQLRRILIAPKLGQNYT